MNRVSELRARGLEAHGGEDEESREIRVRILVLGDEGVGKSALVSALCGNNMSNVPNVHGGRKNVSSSVTSAGARNMNDDPYGVRVSVRRQTNAAHSFAVEEYVVLSGSERYIPAREAIARFGYDGVILVHNGMYSNSRTALRRVWTPLAMKWLGDGASVRAAGKTTHIHSRGVINELAVLWRSVRSAYVAISGLQAVIEALRLVWRLICLLLHESGIWILDQVDQAVEHELIAGAEVPVCILGFYSNDDMLDCLPSRKEPPFAKESRDVFVVDSSQYDIADNQAFNGGFLQRCTQVVRDGGDTPKHRRLRSNKSCSQLAVALPF